MCHGVNDYMCSGPRTLGKSTKTGYEIIRKERKYCNYKYAHLTSTATSPWQPSVTGDYKRREKCTVRTPTKFRAEPALNHSIWPSLKEWARGISYTTHQKDIILDSAYTHILGAIRVLGHESQVLTRREGLQTQNVDLVIRTNPVIVFGIDKGQGKHTLLLQVGFVDTGEGANDDSKATKESGLKSSVFTGRALAIVVVTNDNPLDSSGLVVGGCQRNSTIDARVVVLDLVCLAILRVDGSNKKVF